MFLIDHDSQQFDNTQSWMGVIELNGNFVGEIFPFEFSLVLFRVNFVSSDDILKGG